MKVDLTTEILDLDGEKIWKDGKKDSPMMVSDVMIVSFKTPLEGDEKDSPEQRIRKFNIMKTLHDQSSQEVDLDAEDVSMIKERVLKVYPSPIIYGRLCEALGESK